MAATDSITITACHAEELRHALNNVIAHQEAIQETVTFPIRPYGSHSLPKEKVRARALLRDMDELKRVSQRLLPPPIPASPDGGKAATRAFGVTEVLEKILLHLSVPDFHRTEDTSQAFRKTVIGASKLQRKLFRTTANSDPLRSLGYVGPFDLHDPWLGYSISCFSDPEEPFSHPSREFPIVYWTALFQSTTGKLPPLSRKVLEMFVAQPPIGSFRFVAQCCDTRGYSGMPDMREHIECVTRLGGVKLRDMNEIAQGLLEEHKLCMDGIPFINDQGFVENTITFWGSSLLTFEPVDDNDPLSRYIPDDDPVWILHTERAKKFEAMQARRIAYIAARRAAAENGEPKFTMQEFEARGAADPGPES
ncbi:hypothetical protein LTS00_003349 [Friedmanniomyces endolithicus]|nr:hypothetical protein LTS00_003349 [Friedmanniomyces endolithicus]